MNVKAIAMGRIETRHDQDVYGNHNPSVDGATAIVAALIEIADAMRDATHAIDQLRDQLSQ